MTAKRVIAICVLLAVGLGCDEALYERLSGSKKGGPASHGPSTAVPTPASQQTRKPPPPAPPPSIPDGYLKARFGMDQKAVMDIYHRAYLRAEGRTFMFVHHLSRDPVEDLKFLFLDDKLYEVQHILKASSADEAKRLYNELLVKYRAKLGPPKAAGYWSDSVRDLRIRNEGSTVTLSVRLIAAAMSAQSYLSPRQR